MRFLPGNHGFLARNLAPVTGLFCVGSQLGTFGLENTTLEGVECHRFSCAAHIAFAVAVVAAVAVAAVVGAAVALTCAGITGTPAEDLNGCSFSELLFRSGAIRSGPVPASLFGSRNAGGNLLDP